jgi:hypothetical protein
MDMMNLPFHFWWKPGKNMSGKSPTKKRWLLICQANNTPASLQIFNDGFLGRNITPLPIEHKAVNPIPWATFSFVYCFQWVLL